MGREQVVELGDHRYTVTPQRIGRLGHETASSVALLTGEGAQEDAGGIVDQLGGGAHTVLHVFIDELMPRHEWLGYQSEEAQREQRYDRLSDRSPTFDQIVTAFEVVMKVNRLDLVKHLRDLLGKDFFQAAARKMALDALMGEDETSTTDESPSSSSPPTPPMTSTPSLTVLRTADRPGNEYETVLDDPSAGTDATPPSRAANGG